MPTWGIARPSASVGCVSMRVGLPALQRGGKAGDVIGFDRDDLRLRPQRFHRQRDARQQAAAADRHDDRVEIRHLFDDLDPHRSLAGDDRRIVVAIDVGEAFLLGDFVRVRFGFAEMRAVHHDASRRACGNYSP